MGLEFGDAREDAFGFGGAAGGLEGAGVLILNRGFVRGEFDGRFEMGNGFEGLFECELGFA